MKHNRNKILRIGALLLLSLLALIYLTGSITTLYLTEYLPDSVNGNTEYNENAFETIDDPASNYSSQEIQDITSNDENTLQKRLTVSATALIDTSVYGRELLNYTQRPKEEKSSLRGSSIVRDNCSISDIRVENCSGKYPNVFTNQYINWLNLAVSDDQVKISIHDNESYELLSNYIDRAEFYDSYLDPTEYTNKELEAVFYSERNGLIVVGSGSEDLFVNGNKVDTVEEGKLIHANLTLGKGKHNISRGDESTDLPVHRAKPAYFYNESQSTLEVSKLYEKPFFSNMTIYGDGFRKKVEIDSGSTQTINIPDRPKKLKFIDSKVEVNETIKSEQTEFKDIDKLTFGMTEKEYKRFKVLVSFIQRIPFNNELNLDSNREINNSYETLQAYN